jgi:hypothetical protein
VPITPLPPRGSWSSRAGLAAHRRAAVVQHRVAHGDLDVLAAAGRHALVERGEDADAPSACRCRCRRWSGPAGTGGSSGWPFTPIVPPIAWAIMSNDR